MSDASEQARTLFAQAQERQAAHDLAASVDLARRALALDPAYVEAMEHLATALVARQRRYAEGLGLIDRATTLRPDDAGLWYAAGWLYEFAAHEARRHPPAAGGMEARALYARASDAFRRCLSLHPEGKLTGDAEDLLDHVENELQSL